MNRLSKAVKDDKDVNDEKLLKVGLGIGRGDLRVEGNFQMGWHRRCVKRYSRKDPLIAPEPETEQINEEIAE